MEKWDNSINTRQSSRIISPKCSNTKKRAFFSLLPRLFLCDRYIHAARRDDVRCGWQTDVVQKLPPFLTLCLSPNAQTARGPTHDSPFCQNMENVYGGGSRGYRPPGSVHPRPTRPAEGKQQEAKTARRCCLFEQIHPSPPFPPPPSCPTPRKSCRRHNHHLSEAPLPLPPTRGAARR